MLVSAQRAVVAATMLAAWPSAGMAQSEVEVRSAPLAAAVNVAATSESVQLAGTVTLDPTLTPEGGERYAMSYGCDVAGVGKGHTSGDDYQMGGHTSASVMFDGPLPATVAASCRVDLMHGAAIQRYDVAVEISLRSDGTVASLAVRNFVAAR
jgi:hypothetical protein